MFFKDLPIQKKLMSVILMTSGAVLILTCTAFFIYELHTFRQSTVQELSILGEIIAANSTAALAFDSPEEAREILSALIAHDHIVEAILYDVGGNPFSAYPQNLSLESLQVIPKSEGYNFTDSHLEGSQPVVQGTRRLGTLFLKSDLKAMDERLRLYGIIVILVVSLSSLLAYLLSKILQKSISKPILSLAETAKAISDRQDYSVRATEGGKDEVGYLNDAFNHMLEQIQEQNRALSAFNKNLEQKVKERTIELENANKEQKVTQREVYEKNKELAQALEELQSTEEQLIKMNNELERRVNERTKDLLASEEELKVKNTELKRTNIDLDNFIYTASHDLKSPISNIEGLTTMLNRLLDQRLEPNEKKLMDMIGLSIIKFKKTIADLAEITKAQKNLNQKMDPISFQEVIEEVLLDLSENFNATKPTIIQDLQSRTVMGSMKNIRSIIYNLVTNAVKYRSPERPLQLEIKTYQEAEYVVLVVKDNGLGINKKYHSKLFHMFKRLHTHVEGTGIGLYIIKRTIENYGGKIEFESEENEGSEFKVYFYQGIA